MKKLAYAAVCLAILATVVIYALPAAQQGNPTKVVGFQRAVSTTPTDSTNRITPTSGYVITKCTIYNAHASQTLAFAVNADGAGTLGVATNGTDFTLAAGQSVTFDCLASLITMDGSGASTTAQVLTYQSPK